MPGAGCLQGFDIHAWLEQLGLGHHAQAFLDQEIDAEVLTDLTDAELQAMGLPLGPRKKLLKALALLRRGRAGPAPRRGAPAAPAPGGAVLRPTPPPHAGAERRNLTVLMCDMVGSTSLATTLDPEALRGIMHGYMDVCTEVVTAFGGHVARYQGDGLMAYFGYPQAQEDAAERAVRAALRLIEAVRTMASPASSHPLHADLSAETVLQTRIGIATGLAVVGDLIGEGAAREEAVVGETPALAARLQALAPPDGVVVAQSTRALLGDVFTLADLGPQSLRGFLRAQPAWRILGENRRRSRFAAVHGGRQSALFGRDAELALLQARWRLAAGGAGQAVLLRGEPGIGKSRLTEALREKLTCLQDGTEEGRPGCDVVLLQCSAYDQTSAWRPVIDWLERAAGFTDADPAEARLERLRALPGVTPALLPALVEVLSVSMPAGTPVPVPGDTPAPVPGDIPAPVPGDTPAPVPGDTPAPVPGDTPAPVPTDSVSRKQRIQAALAAVLLGLPPGRARLLVVEDAHWIDASTLDLLGQVLACLPDRPVLALVTARPEFHPAWPAGAAVAELELDRLETAGAEALAEAVAGAAVLPAPLRAVLVERAGGVPLFIEELTRSLLEAQRDQAGLAADGLPGPRATDAAQVPATLQDTLMARLDRLGPAKAVAQIAAVLGREFSHPLLAACAGISRPRLQEALARLAEAGLVQAHGESAGAVYTFRHALMRDAAYGSLLMARRAALHGAVARTLQTRFARAARDQPELVAHHYTEAGDNGPAIAWWRNAAAHAAARHAPAEAVRHLDAALGLLAREPAGAARDRLEVALRTSLAGLLVVVAGYGSPRMEANLERLGQLLETSEPSTEAAFLLYNQSAMLLLRSELDRAAEVARRCVVVSERLGLPNLPVSGQRLLGYAALLQGEIATADRWFSLSREGYDPRVNRAIFANRVVAHDPLVSIMAQDVPLLLQKGLLDQARARGRAALAEAERIDSPSSVAYALMHVGLAWMIAGDPQAAAEGAREMARLVSRGGWLRWDSEVQQGWLEAKDGALDAGLARMRQGQRLGESMQLRAWQPFYLMLEAELLIEHGRHAEALGILDACERLAVRLGQTFPMAELYRHRAIALGVAGGPAAAVESALEAALGTARRQGMRFYELRAATSLARLRLRSGQAAGGHALLAPVLAGFREGLRTPDLREAAAVLHALAEFGPEARLG